MRGDAVQIVSREPELDRFQAGLSFPVIELDLPSINVSLKQSCRRRDKVSREQIGWLSIINA